MVSAAELQVPDLLALTDRSLVLFLVERRRRRDALPYYFVKFIIPCYNLIMITRSEKETRIFAAKFAKTLKGGEILVFTGDLGGGKTTFTRGLAEGLQLEGAVTSPTFVIMQLYKPLAKAKKKLTLYHFDLYRIKTATELFNLGFEDFLNDENAVIVLEWGEKFLDSLPKNAKQIFFKNLGGETREILID